MSLNLLIVEGNLHKENKNFKEAGIKTHTESLKDTLFYLNNDLNVDVFNPCSEDNFNKTISIIGKYDGLIWGGSSLNIYNECIEIKRQILFMRECFKNIKKILGICWGMQVAVTAAGGEVKKAKNGPHIGIAKNITLSENGKQHKLYKEKNTTFHSPAFNYDEVITLPAGAINLSSNKINKVQSLNFNCGKSEIWGLQYHPEISYDKMISLIRFRKDRLIYLKKLFDDEKGLENHINFINQEKRNSNKEARTREIKNWLDSFY